MSQVESPTASNADPFCPGCGYNLRGIQSDRCPECGLVINWQDLAKSIIPWSYRHNMGGWRAFWRTVWLISRHPVAIARDIGRPVSYDDARRFRWLVVLLAWLPMAATALVLRAVAGDLEGPNPSYNVMWANQLSPLMDVVAPVWAGMFSWPVPLLAILLFLAIATGASTYFFHPGNISITQQNRAIGIGLYSCAPLALSFVPCAALFAASMLHVLKVSEHTAAFQIFVVLICIGSAGLPLLFAISWVRALFLLKYTTHCSSSRVMTAAIVLPLIWMIAAAMAIGFMMIWGTAKLMIYSYM